MNNPTIYEAVSEIGVWVNLSKVEEMPCLEGSFIRDAVTKNPISSAGLEYRDKYSKVVATLNDYAKYHLSELEYLRPLPSHVAISVERLEAYKEVVSALEDCINSIQYCAFNVEDKKIEDLQPGLIDTTGPVDSILLSARNAKQALQHLSTIK